MEAKINIVEILKDKPQGTKLYSSACGKCELKEADDKSFKVSFYSSKFGFMNGGEGTFDKNGKLYDDGECVVFPSKEMRDWRKFSWKKGDVLVSNDGKREVLFKTWERDSYTKFVGLHCLITNDNEEVEYDNGTTVFNTNDFKGIEAEDVAQTYINTIEERLGGKLNRETLEVEQPKREFKDGDIVTLKIPNLKKNIRIFKEVVNKKMHENHYYVGFNFDDDGRPIQIFKDYYAYTDNDRPATDSEKQQLFSALAKEGKRWNPDTKQIEDLPKKCEFKPMDWCLMRDVDEVEYRGFVTSEWVLCQFSHYLEGYKFVAVGGNWFGECIPYNEETAHLLGTTDEWKGGEQ